mgnify:CR=1 FL=1
MKRVITYLLAALMACSMLFAAGCSDPLQDKINEMNAVYATLGDSYFRVCEAAAFDGSAQESEVGSRLTEWKDKIKQAKTDVAGYLDYDEAQMDAFIADWTAMRDEMDALYEEHKDAILEARQWLEEMGG